MFYILKNENVGVKVRYSIFDDKMNFVRETVDYPCDMKELVKTGHYKVISAMDYHRHITKGIK